MRGTLSPAAHRSARAHPEVSVLLPFRDCAPWIGGTLADLRAQTLGAFEVVAVDDGSTDGGPESVREVAARDPRVRLLSPGRVGLVGALNLGLAACRAPLVARMDGDDRCRPERLESQVAFLAAHPGVAVLDSRYVPFRDDGPVGEGFAAYAAWHDGIEDHASFEREMLVENPVCHPAAVFRKAWVDRVGGYRPGPFPEDYDLWLRLARAGARFHKLPERLVSWRDHGARSTRTDRRYTEAGFFPLKWDHLVATRLPRRSVRVAVWGAGPSARPWTSALVARGQDVAAVIDIDPRKVGRTRHGVPIVSGDAVDSLTVDLLLVCVGARGARTQIRDRLRSSGRREGRDFLFLR